MSFCSFADGSAMFDSTPVENLFLLEYLPAAPEGFLRVYLYARMLALHPELGGDLAGLARTLRMEEEAVYDAFRYWEQQGLARRLTDNPPTYELLPVRSDGLSLNPMERDYYEYRDFNAALQAFFRKRLLQPHEYRMANDWLNVYGLEQDAVLKMVEREIARSRSKDPDPGRLFKRLDGIARAWADRGVRTAEDVERAAAEDDGLSQTAQAVLKRFALRRQPTVDELECVKRWMGEWGYTEAEILEACGETTKSRQPSFAYLEAILRSRREADPGLRDGLVAALRELDAPNAQPTPDLMKRYAALRAAGFEDATIRLAAVQNHRKRKHQFEDLEWMLAKWGEQGLYTAEAAEAYLAEMEQWRARMRGILERCGLERKPNLNDLSLYEKWRAVHPDDVIDYAADCARGMQLPVKYMDKLLTAWQEAGANTVEAARAQHEAARDNRMNGGTAKANPALDYEQRDYREEDYGDDFFVDLSQYGKGDKA